MLNIRVNDEPRQVEDGQTVLDLLGVLKLDKDKVAIERNRRLVPGDRYATTVLKDGDELEVVTFVGGG